MVVCRGFSILVVSVLLLLTACGGLTEDLRPLAPGLAIDDPMPEENRDGTYIGSPVNDPGSKDGINILRNGVVVKDSIRFAPGDVLTFSLRPNWNVLDRYFVMDSGPSAPSESLYQDSLSWSDISGRHRVRIHCVVVIEVGGQSEWLISDSVVVELSKLEGLLVDDGLIEGASTGSHVQGFQP
jgi:hypothetical protein